jgi:fructose-1-phosphate kinase PfkB-like protein
LLIATPNITVDRTVRLAQLRRGSVLRPARAVMTAGGKEVNVGRVAAAFGRHSTLAGFRPEDDSAVLDRLFAAELIDFVGVPVAGAVRVATICLENSGRVTVLNEPDPQIAPDGWHRYERAVADELGRGRHLTLACTCSPPPGAPDDGYGRLVAIGRAAGVRVVVDATWAALAGVLGAGPGIVTPNLAEAEGSLRGHPIGAGDSFVGGPVEALEEGRTGLEMVRFAVATATASVDHELAGGVDPRRVREIAAQLTRPDGDRAADAATGAAT